MKPGGASFVEQAARLLAFVTLLVVLITGAGGRLSYGWQQWGEWSETDWQSGPDPPLAEASTHLCCE